MIALIDDDLLTLAQVKDVLCGAGYEVAPFAHPAAALAAMEAYEPSLVISDVVMPEMSGLELRARYGERFAERRTPFVFLSSLRETDDVVRGLEAGADDYLTKPVAPELLLARVRAHLRRARLAPVQAFHGDLQKVPLARVVEFCELQRLTGEVEVASGAFRAVVPFRGGAVVDEGELDGETIARAFELRSGTFAIRTRPVDFDEIADAARPHDAPLDPGSRPAGRLSAVTVGDRLVQLQTEYVTAPAPAVESVALRDGRTLLKRSVRAAGTRDAVARLVESQHAELELEVRRKLAALAAARAGEAAPEGSARPAPEPVAAFGTLFERGLNAFLSNDLEGALAAWEQAAAIDPEHATLQVNLGVVRRKLGRG